MKLGIQAWAYRLVHVGYPPQLVARVADTIDSLSLEGTGGCDVVVSNIGAVLTDADIFTAAQWFMDYAIKSAGDDGRAAGEDVSLFYNGEEVLEFPS